MDRSKANYQIIKRKHESTSGAEVIEVVKGEARASQLADFYNEKLTPQENAEGWRCYASLTKLKPGTDPALATRILWIQSHRRPMS